MRKVLLALLLVGSCTTIGVDTPQDFDWGPQVDIDICVLIDPEVGDKRAQKVSDYSKAEFEQYGISLHFTYEPWVPPKTNIIAALQAIPLKAPCDRIFAYIGRPVKQQLKGFVVSIEGEVDNASGSYGYGYVSGFSPAVLVVGSGKRLVAHEFYHLMGCGHSLSKAGCYQQMIEMKRRTESDFPSSYSFSHKRWLDERVFFIPDK